MKPTQEVHPILAALRARKRTTHAFDVSGYIGLGDVPVPKVAVRVATKREQDEAVEAAKLYAQAHAKNAWEDPDVLQDAKAAALVACCIRDVEKPDKMPVYPDVEEICRLCTPDQIGALLNLVNQVRRAESPDPDDVTIEGVQALARLCVAVESAEDVPEHVLARVSRVKLEQAFILLACMWAKSVDAPSAETQVQ